MIKNNSIICGDCLEIMKDIPDKSIDLVLTDPPYGINIIKNGMCGGTNSQSKMAKMGDYSFANNNWDKEKPKKEFFDEIIRISKNQIIFGANHFISQIPYNSSCWIVWDKDNEKSLFADCELAWTSFKTAVKKYKIRWNGMLQEDMKNKEHRFHPTQKPVELMRRILVDYSEEDNLILDCFAGSGSALIACQELHRNFIGIEISPEYCKIAENRLKQKPLF